MESDVPTDCSKGRTGAVVYDSKVLVWIRLLLVWCSLTARMQGTQGRLTCRLVDDFFFFEDVIVKSFDEYELGLVVEGVQVKVINGLILLR